MTVNISEANKININKAAPAPPGIIRQPEIKIIIERWDFVNGQKKEPTPYNITNFCLSFVFQKSIKTPESLCKLNVLPQYEDINIMDFFNTMDVLFIYEFGVLKWQGYIKNIAFSGFIDGSGKPKRFATISASGFGGLLTMASLGAEVCILLKKGDLFATKAKTLGNKFGDLIKKKGLFGDVISVFIDYWREFVTGIGGSAFFNYFDTYIDYKTGTNVSLPAAYPRSVYLFIGTENRVSIFDAITKIIDPPFNEFWIDTGVRSDLKLTENKTYCVFRRTPFDGTFMRGYEENLFKALPSLFIPLNHLLRFDLNKTIDETFSFYQAFSDIYDASTLQGLANGIYEKSNENFNKVLYKPLRVPLFYTRLMSTTSTKKDTEANKSNTYAKNMSITLKNWYNNNDKFLSGSFSICVPNKNEDDPKIGQKIELEGIEGAFYAESISHFWTYGQVLRSDIAVTRGWNDTKAIELKNKIFTNKSPNSVIKSL